MRKLLNTLYITSENLSLKLENSNVIIQKDQEEITRLPLHTLEAIVSFSRSSISVPLIAACSRHGIPVFLMSKKGNLLAEISVPSRGNILLRKEQYRAADNPAKNASFTTAFILGKIRNQKHTTDRFIWEHRQDGIGQDTELIKHSAQLNLLLKNAEGATGPDSLRGIEGEASAIYFSCFDKLITGRSEAFKFNGRTRRPPLDRTNALLSFGYVLIQNECAAALESVGLDAEAGFLHEDHPGRKSLACDLTEEFRSAIVDRFVISLINRKIIQLDHFDFPDSGGVYLNGDGKKVFLHHWQLNKKEEINHPILNESIPIGLLPYAQATLLARAIRGDINEYHPFFRR